MLVRTDPFREFDRLTQQALGTMTRPAVMPMDAWRDNVEVVVAFDLPGVEPDSIDIDVERNLLTVKAERRSPAGPDSEMVVAERPSGGFSRQLIVSDMLDTDRIQASYDAGVLTLRIPSPRRRSPAKSPSRRATPPPQ
jgi:HSP20 family protein